jgi:hypothetical protein
MHQIETGQCLTVSIQPSGGKAMTFRPKVLLAAPNTELRWLGNLLIPGIFDGEHHIKIAQMDSGRVRFTQGERFSGLLVGMAKASLDRGTKAGFIAMIAALKARAENSSTQWRTNSAAAADIRSGLPVDRRNVCRKSTEGPTEGVH